MRSIICILLSLSLFGCVQYGTIGNGELEPSEKEILDQAADIISEFIKKKQEKDEEVVVPDEPEVTPDDPQPTPDPDPDPVPPIVTNKEYGNYIGRHNGDRPHWYFSKLMKQYPSTFKFTIPGCVKDQQITNDGHRWPVGSNSIAPLIVKQSDVAGRGLAIIGQQSCKSTQAYIEY